jgi:uncharacterized protein YndB with AHSA1/START domain
VKTKESITRKLRVPAARVWEAVSAIGRLEVWFPIIETCAVEGRGPGAIRRMTLVNGGGQIHDTIESIDPARRRLVYRRPVSPFAVTSYRGTVEVFESYDGLGVAVWTIDFESEPENAQSVADLVKGAIGDGLAGMDQDLLADAARQ